MKSTARATAMAGRLPGLACLMMTVLLPVWGGMNGVALRAQEALPVNRHELSLASQPPGVVAFHALLGNPQWVAQIQPVRITVPAEASVGIWGGGGFLPATAPAPVVGLTVGPVARFRVEFQRPEQTREVFPSVELISRLNPPPGEELKFPVEIVLTMDDLIQASEGRMVTRVVYLENPETALPFRQLAGEQAFVDIGDWEDPLTVAARLGRPMAIVRLGSRTPSVSEMDASFHFGGAPIQEFPQQFFDPPAQDVPAGNIVPPTQSLLQPRRNGMDGTNGTVQPVQWQEPQAEGNQATADLAAAGREPFLPAVAGDGPGNPIRTNPASVSGTNMTPERTAPAAGTRIGSTLPVHTGSAPARDVAFRLSDANGVEPFVSRERQEGEGPMSLPPSITGGMTTGNVPFQADWQGPSAVVPGTAPAWINPCDPVMDAGCGCGPTMAGPGACQGEFRFSMPVSRDEFVCDGDDRNLEVLVDQNWRIYGLDTEDTVGHFDTLDGRRLVVPSNRTCIYSPRFASVRHVRDLVASAGATQLVEFRDRDQMQTTRGEDFSSTTLQQLMPGLNVGARRASGVSEMTRGVLADQVVHMNGLRGGFEPYEDLQFIRFGRSTASEGTRLQLGRQSAGVWQANDGMQVIIDRNQPVVVNDALGAQEMVTVKVGDGSTQLRVCKIASKISAQPGEEVEFTIRFDNTGGQLIGNVTILDSLTPRLEYVANSAECSLKGDFLTERNEGESLVLRWEITEPMKPGEGGIIRFRCRVR